jgi:UDP-3-O-[3-hydroxymyristoyl] N-acetylglucosamine deacetylase
MMQRTLRASALCQGIGLHSGAQVRLEIAPASTDSGICFIRSDLPAERRRIPALWHRVTDSQLCTLLRNDQAGSVATVEHLLAALRGCGVDNADLILDGPEVPIMDGSAAPFAAMIEAVGIVAQGKPQRRLRLLRPFSVGDHHKRISLSPAPVSSFHVEIVYERQPLIRHQQTTWRIGMPYFSRDLAPARTFGFLQEAEILREKGLALGASLDNALIFDGDRVLNPGGLRFPDECSRHKTLDAIGDISLAGAPLLAHYHGTRPGHAMNAAVLRALFADQSLYRWQSADEITPSLTEPWAKKSA